MSTCCLLAAALTALLIIIVALVAAASARLAAEGRKAEAAMQGWAAILSPSCIDDITPLGCLGFLAPPGPPPNPLAARAPGFDAEATTYAARIVGRFVAFLGGAPGTAGLMVLPGLGPPSYAYIPQDAQALAATWVTPDGELAVVAIRGTATMDDLLSDLEYSETVGSVADPRVRVHGGMAAVYQAAKPALFAAVPPTAKALFIAGHSLGAAVAFLYAFDAAAAAPGRARPLAVEVHGLAPPRVGNPAFASLLASRARTATLVNLADLVPTLPWSFMPNIQTPAAPDAYAHVPPVAAFEALRSDIVSCHDIFTYYAGISAPPAIVPRPRPSARAPGA